MSSMWKQHLITRFRSNFMFMHWNEQTSALWVSHISVKRAWVGRNFMARPGPFCVTKFSAQPDPMQGSISNTAHCQHYLHIHKVKMAFLHWYSLFYNLSDFIFSLLMSDHLCNSDKCFTSYQHYYKISLRSWEFSFHLSKNCRQGNMFSCGGALCRVISSFKWDTRSLFLLTG